LRGRAGRKRFCIPAGENVLEADGQRKVLEARLATGATIPMTAVATTVAGSDRKVIAAEATAYLERTRKSKKPKTYKGYKDAVELFVATCKKAYLDELSRDDMIDFKEMLKSRYASQTVFKQFRRQP
jgi:hypothetical protein